MTSVDLNFWIKSLAAPRHEIGGLPVCPFAKEANFSVIETTGKIEPPDLSGIELIIYVLPDTYDVSRVYSIANHLNKIYTDLIFLPDHKDKKTEINGVQTNNGRKNLILCQNRSDLEKARSKLQNTNYYTFWDPDYLNEILNS